MATNIKRKKFSEIIMAPRTVDASRDENLPFISNRQFPEIQPQPVTSVTPAPMMQGQTAVGSLIPIPTPRPEPESWWQTGLRKFAEVASHPLYKDLGNFLMSAGTASPTGGWQEALQKGTQGMLQASQNEAAQNKTIAMLKSMGFSDQEAQGMAQNPDLIKTMLQNRMQERELAMKQAETQPNLQEGRLDLKNQTILKKISGIEELVPISIQPKDIAEAKVKLSQLKSATTQNKLETNDLLNTVDQLTKAVQEDVSGSKYGGFLATGRSLLRGSDQHTYSLGIDKIQNSMILKKILQFKEQGGTLGQISDKDVEIFRDAQNYLGFHADRKRKIEGLQAVRRMLTASRKLQEEEYKSLLPLLQAQAFEKSSVTYQGKEIPVFRSVEEAEKSDLPDGSVFNIEGTKRVVRIDRRGR